MNRSVIGPPVISSEVAISPELMGVAEWPTQALPLASDEKGVDTACRRRRGCGIHWGHPSE